jgi:hypothetical protein
MSEEPDSDHFLSTLERLNLCDPLSENTRKERRFLLGLSFIAVAVAQTGLIPTKIEALGIAVEKTDQKAILFLLAVLVAYLLITFIIYATIDFVRFRGAYNSALLNHLQTEHGFYREKDEPKDPPHERTRKRLRRRIGFYMVMSRRSSFVRTVWEFLFPIVMGTYAIAVAFWTRAHIS